VLSPPPSPPRISEATPKRSADVKAARRTKIAPSRSTAPDRAAVPKTAEPVAASPAAQVALPASSDKDANSLSASEMLVAFMVAASVLLLLFASLPTRIWFRYSPDVIWVVGRMRGPLAVVGGAVLLGIGIGYLAVLFQFT
jgi:hypothetical protein